MMSIALPVIGQVISKSTFGDPVVNQLNDLAGLTSAEADYTPVWTSGGTQPTIGNGSLIGAYQSFGNRVRVWLRLVWGSTTSGGTGRWLFTLPFTPNHEGVLAATCYDVSAGIPYPAIARFTGDSEHVGRIGAHTVAGAAGIAQTGHPFTWATGDTLMFQGEYEV